MSQSNWPSQAYNAPPPQKKAEQQEPQPAKEPTMASKVGMWWQKSKLLTWWERSKKTLIIIAVVIIVLLIAFALFALAVRQFGWDWTGFNGGVNKVTKTPQGTNTEYQPRKTLWDLLLLGSSIATTLAIFAAGWWFITNRSLAGSAEVSLSLKDVTIVNGIRIAIVGVRIKNLGHTKIERYSCASAITAIDVEPYSEGIQFISEKPFDYHSHQEIFDTLNAIEPNEEVFRDIAFTLDKTTFFKVRVIFTQKRVIFTQRSWESVSVFNVDDKARVPTPTDLFKPRQVILDIYHSDLLD